MNDAPLPKPTESPIIFERRIHQRRFADGRPCENVIEIVLPDGVTLPPLFTPFEFVLDEPGVPPRVGGRDQVVGLRTIEIPLPGAASINEAFDRAAAIIASPECQAFIDRVMEIRYGPARRILGPNGARLGGLPPGRFRPKDRRPNN